MTTQLDRVPCLPRQSLEAARHARFVGIRCTLLEESRETATVGVALLYDDDCRLAHSASESAWHLKRGVSAPLVYDDQVSGGAPGLLPERAQGRERSSGTNRTPHSESASPDGQATAS
jgi:hypothetical protein